MAITAADQGFFTSDGVLRQENLSSSSSQGSTKNADSTSSSSNISASMAEYTTDTTAVAITDAVVIKITQQMNVGSTGFDSGVSAMVQEAVMSALRNKSGGSSMVSPQLNNGSTNIMTSNRLELGGAYQNEILASAQKSQTQTSIPETPSEESSKASPQVEPGSKNDQNKGQIKKYELGGAYQKQLAAEAKKADKS
ncbi:MAG: hypothetical protein GYA55_05980 [SAR324 cluster bacterium]|uniref:Uncharacterized protein n=1 Tax=SAR324 cluster bacterium TaxID=2024889 RepID=A0A7X9FRT5_9DELT|nr:hypothetical protein [SAR324 cluster bacterium]